MNPQELHEHCVLLARQTGLPDPGPLTCTWVYARMRDDGRYEYKCSQCGDTQIVDDMIGATETRACRP